MNLFLEIFNIFHISSLAAVGLVFLYYSFYKAFLPSDRAQGRFFLFLSIGWILNLAYLAFLDVGPQLARLGQAQVSQSTESVSEGYALVENVVVRALNTLTYCFFLLASRWRLLGKLPRLMSHRSIGILISVALLLPFFTFIVPDLAPSLMAPSILTGMASIFLVGINFQLYFKETRQHYKPRVKTTLVYSMYIYALLQLGVFMLPPYLDTPQNTFSHLEELFFLAGMALKLIHLVGLTQYGQAFYADYSYKIHMFNRAALTKDATDQLAHELQTPLLELKVRLTNIFGEESNDTEETKERKGIENLVEQISSLIHGFQRFHQDQLGDGARHPSICNLNVACDTSLYALKIALRPKIKFNKNYNSGTTLVAIESELDQILRNLIKNAIESVEEKRKLAREMGIIHFETFVEHGRSGDALFVGVNIEDNGVGINADIIDSIFEEGVTTKDGYGRGHGLFIVKTLVERNGGSASATNITSNGETTGASFVVRFPFAAKKASDKPEESSSSVRNSPIPQRQKLSSFAKDGAKTFDHGSEIPRN